MTATPSRRRILAAMLAGVGAPLAGALPSIGHAQAFPAKPIRLIVPFAAGGSADILGRLISPDLFAGAARQPVVVENIAGAGGNIGASMVARSPGDGYTLEVGVMSTHAMNGSLYKNLPFDPMKDFDTVAMLAYAINVIAVGPGIPVSTMPELLAYVRANPGKVDYASGGVGTHNHLTLALLAKTANLDIVHVPYKGGGPAVAALVQGECGLFAGGASLLLPHARAGKIKLIAVTESTRSTLLPDIPTVAETIPSFEVTNWYGVWGPRDMDPSRRTLLNQEINRVTGLPDVAERFKQLGMVRAPVTPARLQEILQADFKLWSNTITSLGITAA